MAKAPTTEEYLEGVKANLRRIGEAKKEIGRVVANVHAKKVDDVFTKGIKARYSSRPTLAGSNVFGNRNRYGGKSYTFATVAGSRKFFGSDAKRRKAEWRTVKTGRGDRPLMVIPGGYKAIRQADGRRVDKVNLTHTGQLFKDYASSLTNRGLSWFTGVRRKENVGKLEGALDKYGQGPWLVSDDDFTAEDIERLGLAVANLLIV